MVAYSPAYCPERRASNCTFLCICFFVACACGHACECEGVADLRGRVFAGGASGVLESKLGQCLLDWSVRANCVSGRECARGPEDASRGLPPWSHRSLILTPRTARDVPQRTSVRTPVPDTARLLVRAPSRVHTEAS
eukprot:6188929-Pleurochrysis_carterae.AAC.1